VKPPISYFIYISCDAPIPQAVVFVTYLGHMEFETESGFPGNCNRVAGT